jgi:hypothetical protein
MRLFALRWLIHTTLCLAMLSGLFGLASAAGDAGKTKKPDIISVGDDIMNTQITPGSGQSSGNCISLLGVKSECDKGPQKAPPGWSFKTGWPNDPFRIMDPKDSPYLVWFDGPQAMEWCILAKNLREFLDKPAPSGWDPEKWAEFKQKWQTDLTKVNQRLTPEIRREHCEEVWRCMSSGFRSSDECRSR